MNKLKVALTLLVILITALLWAAAAAPTQAPALTMRRESRPLNYLTALDQSLAHGVSSVNWQKVTWPEL